MLLFKTCLFITKTLNSKLFEMEWWVIITWNDYFELLGGSDSVTDIQDYMDHIIKKHWTFPNAG